LVRWLSTRKLDIGTAILGSFLDPIGGEMMEWCRLLEDVKGENLGKSPKPSLPAVIQERSILGGYPVQNIYYGDSQTGLRGGKLIMQPPSRSPACICHPQVYQYYALAESSSRNS
jgi:hypothetical protein